MRSIMMIVFALLITLTLPGMVDALDASRQMKFQEYMNMTLQELAAASDARLAEKYPDEDWSAWHFPDYVNVDLPTRTSYRIAVKQPDILGKVNVDDEQQVIPCYCTCRTFGHENLLYCFWKDGKPGGIFDEHGSQCAVCMRQAFLVFLWNDLGATHAEIMQGMHEKFAPLIKMQEEGKL